MCNGTSKIVYLAESYLQQTTGMMYRNSFEGAYGILFVFNSTQQACMWMENTEIPLEQVWILKNGTISYIYNATPFSLDTKCAQAAYVLETTPNSVNKNYRFLIG